MAITTAICIVAGIVGRKFNISNNGLNVYFTILAESSVGKGSIKEFITMIRNDEKALGSFTSFFRFGGVTSGKALIQPLVNARSHLRVIDEAGVASLSKSGDPHTANAAYLDLWPVSGKYGMADGRDYVGSDDNSIKSLRSPALSTLNISTPDSYKEMFYKSKAIDTGMAARITVVNIDGNLLSNRNRVMRVRGSVMEKLRYLAQICSQVQSSEDPNCWDIGMPESLEIKSRKIRDEYDKKKYVLSKNKSNMAHIYGRSHLKSLRYMHLQGQLANLLLVHIQKMMRNSGVR